MTRWTHDGAYAVAYFVATVGCAGLPLGWGWSAVAAIGLGVGLVGACRALEYSEATRKAADVVDEVVALRKRLEALTVDVPKVQETADNALRTARAAAEVRHKQTY